MCTPQHPAVGQGRRIERFARGLVRLGVAGQFSLVARAGLSQVLIVKELI